MKVQHDLLSELPTVGAVLLGFQLTALAWRIRREIEMEAEEEQTWLPPADMTVLVSMFLTGLVLILPLLGGSQELVRYLFGCAIIFLVGYPFALAGHYHLIIPIAREDGRPRCTGQELTVLVILGIVVVGFTGVYWAT